MVSKIAEIRNFGQKIWIDNISRELILSKELERLISEDGIAGVTSNPTIFHKAISQDKNYQVDLFQVKQTQLDAEARYEQLVIPDIQAACDILTPMYIESEYEDGYVSFEVSPYLANDVHGTIENAKRLWQAIHRPNLMIKIPATPSGIIALEQLIFEGINVNITLLFTLNQVIATWKAYIKGLRRRYNHDLPLNTIKSVASFFLSRIDSAIDEKLPQELQGKSAINVAKMAYLAYTETFSSEMFGQLKKKGAREQYLLWASTGTKNTKYSDVLYVEELIGDQTINTVPDNTLNAFRDHGKAQSTLTPKIENAPSIITQIQQFVNLDEIGDQLQNDGLVLFENSFKSLLQLVQ